jgi:hypothetical protein
MRTSILENVEANEKELIFRYISLLENYGNFGCG